MRYNGVIRFFYRIRMNGNRILIRMVVGYLLIVYIPIGLFSMYSINFINQQMRTEYAFQKQQYISKNLKQLSQQLKDIENAYNTLQGNWIFTEYLREEGKEDKDIVYTYLKYINYSFSEIKSINPAYITDIKIYTNNKDCLKLQSEFVPLKYAKEVYRKGKWEHHESSKGSTLTFRHNIYDNTFNRWLGVFEITVQEEIIPSYLLQIDETKETKNKFLIIVPDRQVLMDSDPILQKMTKKQQERLVKSIREEGSFVLAGKRNRTFNAIYIGELNLFYLEEEDYTVTTSSNIRREKMQMYGLIAVLIGVLSLFYYLIIADALRRILLLSKHIRKVDENNLTLIKANRRHDEIGYLYSSYNAMITRIKNLITSLYREEMLRKDAVYASLQAKIQPHFLYGTLEMIRMMALQNKDLETAEITYSFAKLMRYSLEESVEVTLQQEINHVINYLDIQKNRLTPRLIYNVNVNADIGEVICPRFILQPVVENAVIHGVSKVLRPCSICIKVDAMRDKYTISVTDNGKGMTEAELVNVRSALENSKYIGHQDTIGNGFALYSVNERVKQFYGEECGLFIESEPDAKTTVTLLIKQKRRLQLS